MTERNGISGTKICVSGSSVAAVVAMVAAEGLFEQRNHWEGSDRYSGSFRTASASAEADVAPVRVRVHNLEGEVHLD